MAVSPPHCPLWCLPEIGAIIEQAKELRFLRPELLCRRRHAMFAANVGTADRMLRIILGIGLLSLVFIGPQTPWGWLGLVPLLTGLMRTCPLYSVFGFNTGAR
jgi:hypothetical protein